MALRMIESFDGQRNSGTAGDPFDSAFRTKFTVSSSTGMYTSSAGRTGDCAELNNDNSFGLRYFESSVLDDKFTIGFALYVSSQGGRIPVVVCRVNTNTRGIWWVNVDGSISLERVVTDLGITSSTGLITTGTWHYVEFQMHARNSSDYACRVDGATVLSGSGADLLVSGAAGVNNIGIFSGPSNIIRVDDLYWLDDTGSDNTSFLGDSTVYRLNPTSDVTSEWTPSAGSDNYALVDDTNGWDSSDYVETSTATNQDEYGCEDLAHTDRPVYGVSLEAHATAGDFKFLVDGVADSTTRTGADLHELILDEDLSSTVWSATNVNSFNYGIEAISGTPRVTRFFVHALQSNVAAVVPITQSLSSAMTLLQSLQSNFKIESITSSLGMAQTVIHQAPIALSVSSAITLAQAIDHLQALPASGSNTMTLTQLLSLSRGLAVSSALSMSDNVNLNATLTRSIANTLSLTQAAIVSGVVMESTSSALIVSQSVLVDHAIINQTTSNTIATAQALQLSREYGTTSTLSLSHSASAYIPTITALTASSNIAISSLAHSILNGGVDVAQSITLQQTLLATIGVVVTPTEVAILESAANTLSVSNSVQVRIGRPFTPDEYPVTMQTILDLKQSVYYTFSEPDFCNYAPQIGSGSGNEPPSTAPILGSAILTLTYNGDSLVLRNPEFTNTDTLNFMRMKTNSLGGTPLFYIDPTWPKQQTLSFRFENLKKTQTDALLVFINASLGQEITLLDHENREWTGIITTPDLEITQQGVNRFATTFDFEGELS